MTWTYYERTVSLTFKWETFEGMVVQGEVKNWIKIVSETLLPKKPQGPSGRPFSLWYALLLWILHSHWQAGLRNTINNLNTLYGDYNNVYTQNIEQGISIFNEGLRCSLKKIEEQIRQVKRKIGKKTTRRLGLNGGAEKFILWLLWGVWKRVVDFNDAEVEI